MAAFSSAFCPTVATSPMLDIEGTDEGWTGGAGAKDATGAAPGATSRPLAPRRPGRGLRIVTSLPANGSSGVLLLMRTPSATYRPQLERQAGELTRLMHGYCATHLECTPQLAGAIDLEVDGAGVIGNLAWGHSHRLHANAR